MQGYYKKSYPKQGYKNYGAPAGKKSVSVLMVAEKPSIATAIANTLGKDVKTRKGLSKVTQIHEYVGDFFGTPAHFKVTSVAGHVFSRDFPSEYESWDKVDPEVLFDAETIKVDNPRENFNMTKHLLSEAQGVDYLILWLDCDREGENICFEIIEVIESLLPVSSEQIIFRAKFSSLAAKDLTNAYLELCEYPNLNESLSVDARQIIDLKVGVAFSRFQTLTLKKKYPGLQLKLVSYGPCQTPTLGFCVEQYNKRLTFVPVDYWYLSASVIKNEAKFNLKWNHDRVYTQSEAETYKLKCMTKEGFVARVLSTTTKDSEKARPCGLNTVNLLKTASKSFGMGAHNTMKIAEKLYLSGFITYPRTESTHYSENFEFKGILNNLVKSPTLGTVAKFALENFTNPIKGLNAGDHPPITPVNCASADQMKPDHWKIYDFISRHFMATILPNAQIQHVVASFQIGSETFNYSGKRIKSPGFLQALPWLAKKYSNSQNFVDKEVLKVGSFAIEKAKTQPPPLLSESELIGKMESYKIGTDASIPTHIQNIIDRGYVNVLPGQRQLEPTNLGIALSRCYYTIDPDLILPTVRASIEDMVNQIAKGEAKFDEVLFKALSLFKEKYVSFAKNVSLLESVIKVTLVNDSDKERQCSFNGLARCFKCKSGLIVIKPKVKNLLVGCTLCKKEINLPQEADRIEKTPQRCIHCEWYMVNIIKDNASIGHRCVKCEMEPKKIRKEKKNKAKLLEEEKKGALPEKKTETAAEEKESKVQEKEAKKPTEQKKEQKKKKKHKKKKQVDIPVVVNPSTEPVIKKE